MSNEQKIAEIFSMFRSKGHVVPRDYQTIGGMWTVDTYAHDEIADVKVQLMDEGWTTRIVSDSLIVSANGNNRVNFERGNIDDLDTLYDRIIGFAA